jgi:hypothetical protein
VLFGETQVDDECVEILLATGNGRGVELPPFVQKAFARRRASETAFGPEGSVIRLKITQ